MVIDTAWDEYRGWAARARELQESSRKWSSAALISAAVAAVLGAAATQISSDLGFGKALSLLAALAAALTPILGKEIIGLGSEAKWIRARATAEAVKSECFRFAARAGDYGGPNAEDQFIARRDALTADAVRAGLSMKNDPVGEKGDKRRPPDPMDAAWYVPNRINEQIAYYSRKQEEHEGAVKRLRYVAFGASAAAALFGVAGLLDQDAFTPWIGALMTIAAVVAAYGLLDRRQYLAASYGAMATSLGRAKERATRLAFPDLVTRTEDLLQSEHAAWTDRMTQTIASPAAAESVQTRERKAGG